MHCPPPPLVITTKKKKKKKKLIMHIIEIPISTKCYFRKLNYSMFTLPSTSHWKQKEQNFQLIITIIFVLWWVYYLLGFAMSNWFDMAVKTQYLHVLGIIARNYIATLLQSFTLWVLCCKPHICSSWQISCNFLFCIIIM